MRKKLLASLHIARKDMALEEESYRALLYRVTGQTSAKELTEEQLRSVLAEFERLGWKKARFRRFAAGNRPDVRKVFAIWSSLRDHLECRGSRAGLRAFVERQVGVSDPNFLNPAQAQKVIEALKAMQRRMKNLT
ncbi:gp16 family protein [Bombella apis]|uniref:gp16 family protein n=1 Tax=Bombella apis TaxID=1785988 RepID=UPI0024A994B1|nr:regulatory protein GemA [Bombella apis]